MMQTQSTVDQPKDKRRIFPLLSGLLLGAVLIGTIFFAISSTQGAHAASDTASAKNAAVAFADANWNCSTAACTHRVSAGSSQPNYQCAEFVARSLAAEGEIPGLTSHSAQSAYGNYKAKNGKTYDLLWVGWANGTYNTGINGLYQYLTQNGVGKDIGNHPSQAVPGDVTIYFEGKGHTGLLVQTGSNPLVDAHNNARYHVNYTEGYSLTIIHIGHYTAPKSCPSTIQNGSKGSTVTTLQSELDSLYSKKAFPNSPYNFHPLLSKDGQFGPLTANAVKDFQKKKGLGVDGIVGPKTWHALGNC
jgi:hypothetical protein